MIGFNMPHTRTIELTFEQLQTLSDIMHGYKDMFRGDYYFIKPVMDIEAELVKQSDGAYEPDPTYDMHPGDPGWVDER